MSEALTDSVHVAWLTSLILGCNGLKDNSDPIKLKFHFQLRMEIVSHSKWSPHTFSSTISHWLSVFWHCLYFMPEKKQEACVCVCCVKAADDWLQPLLPANCRSPNAGRTGKSWSAGSSVQHSGCREGGQFVLFYLQLYSIINFSTLFFQFLFTQ